MIRVLNAPPGYRELRALGTPAPIRIEQVASALPTELIARFARPLERMTARWGTVAASSFTASFLGEMAGDDGADFAISVREFGALAWVEAGHGLMRPNPFAPWFSFDGTWISLVRAQGLQRLIRENADGALSDPAKTLEAVRAAELELQLSGPIAVVGRTVTVGEAKYHGCIGPGVLEVDTGSFTLSTARTEPWKQQYAE